MKKEWKYFVTVQPGLIYDRLNLFLKPKGLFLPPEPSSSWICMIGGNVATKARGLRGVKYGSMDEYTRGIEFITADGRLINTSSLNGAEDIKIKSIKRRAEK